MDAYGSFTATRRFVKPQTTTPEPSSVGNCGGLDTMTSYQHSYFAQSDAPRASDPRCASKPIRGVRPASTVQHVLQQSGTTTADFATTTKASYRPDNSSTNKVIIERKQDPKSVPTSYPAAIDRTRVRGK
ncbi:Hypothetical protein, putative [Bodo saltans]|uniref:Uncharacterized protein n=1 Tax=Bodo saltans TaxID=75058 RepID=A0A0S4KKQ4_BODSA|nr:Hypothetical protein, putative [Bodo saltans]|eukprot:CUI14211.1 Hypothetical protein, putative [Bodo saltans]